MSCIIYDGNRVSLVSQETFKQEYGYLNGSYEVLNSFYFTIYRLDKRYFTFCDVSLLTMENKLLNLPVCFAVVHKNTDGDVVGLSSSHVSLLLSEIVINKFINVQSFGLNLFSLNSVKRLKI